MMGAHRCSEPPACEVAADEDALRRAIHDWASWGKESVSLQLEPDGLNQIICMQPAIGLPTKYMVSATFDLFFDVFRGLQVLLSANSMLLAPLPSSCD